MRLLLKIILGLVLLVVVLVALAYATGNDHLVRGVRYTYLIGRTAPEIDDRDFFPSAIIRATSPQPWSHGSRYGKLALNAEQEQKLKEFHSVGFALVQDDSLIFEQYWNGWHKDSVLNSFSVAKSYIALLAGVALKEGRITDLEQKVGEFLPEFAAGCHARITLRHLLTMSTGLDFSESGSDPFSDAARAYYGRNVRRVAFEQPCREEPGVSFDYISGSTQIMAAVLEAAYGRWLNDLVQEKIWTPLGAESDAWWGKDREDGDFRAFCCLYASNRDLAKLGQLYLDSGRWKGEEIITKEYWQESLTPADLRDGDGPNDRYGYYWWLAQDENEPVHYARGFHGEYVVVLPQQRLVMVRTGMKREEVNAQGHPRDVFEWIRIARELTSDRPGGPHIAAGSP